jgi:hypothetical protein
MTRVPARAVTAIMEKSRRAWRKMSEKNLGMPENRRFPEVGRRDSVHVSTEGVVVPSVPLVGEGRSAPGRVPCGRLFS